MASLPDSGRLNGHTPSRCNAGYSGRNRSFLRRAFPLDPPPRSDRGRSCVTRMPNAFSYRDDPNVPAFPDDRPIVIYDGHCRLCSGFVRFVLRHDRQERFRFIAAQSALGTALYRHYDLDSVDYETNILLEQGRPWFKSESSIRIFEQLGFPWTFAALGRVLPLSWRDLLYEFIARNRLKWFGVRKACYLLDPGQEHRFIG